MHKPAVRQLCAFAALFLWIFPMRCAAQASPCEQARFADDATPLYKAATENAGKEGADVVVFCDETHFVFDNEGKARRSDYLVYKVLTQRGAEGWDNLSREWEPWHEAKPVMRARVINEEKGTQWLDQKTINDAPANESEDKVYSDRRVEQAPLPAVTPGVVVEQEIVESESAPFFSAGRVEQLVLVRSGPVRESRLVIEAPSALPLRYTTKLLPKIQIKKTEANQIARLDFVEDSLEAYEDAEKLRPGDVAAYPTVQFSTGKSWQDVARTYSEIVDKQGKASDVKALVAGLTKGKNSRQSKIEAVVQYLSREIRYTGIEFDEAAIVPHKPEETLKRKYGDCKDKATLLVAMLRAADIPANVALLNVAGWTDSDQELPGLGSFDHAIVEVPGSPEYWIDATAEFARLGQVPSGDQGRLALIADASTEELKRIPVASSDENRMVEKREIRLAENGPASVTEISEPHGVFEENYRSWYVDEISKDTRKNLAEYVKTQYVAEKLGKVVKGDATDLSKDFTLTLEAEKARRGYTDLDNAVAVIRLEGLFSNLPKSLREKEEKAEKKDDGSEAKSKKERTVDYQLPEAFASEWDYTIVPPPGFQAKELPASRKHAMGPGTLDISFVKRADEAVEAKLHFDMPKRRFTVKEAAELRQQVVELSGAEPLIVSFEPKATVLMGAGKARESFAAWKELIAKHPTEAVHHLQYAKALLAVGLGEPARSEAREAVKLEPQSALAEKTLAEISEYDLVGRKFKPGSDYAGAEAAFRGAQKLDAEDTTVTGNLAILLEYNREGERYGTGAKLREAVAEYRRLKEDELANIGLKNNLGFGMFYAGEFSEAKAYAEKLNPAPNTLIVAAETGMNGAAAGIAEAKKRIEKEEDLKKALVSAGDMVMRTRRYVDAADLMEAGANGSNASNTIALAGYLKKAKKHEELKFDDSPAGLLLEYFVKIGSDQLTQEWMKKKASRNAQKLESRKDAVELAETLKAGRNLRIALSSNGIPADVMLDIVLQAADMHTEGNDETGYRVNWPLGRGLKMFVVKEEGTYKVLDSTQDPNSIGFEILDREKAGDLKGARVLLDWLREEQHVEGGDDPLAGKAFPRMWTKGGEGGSEEIRRAAAAILCQSKHTARDGISLLEPELEKIARDTDKLNIRLALLEGYGSAEQREKRYATATELAKTYPDSKSLFLAREYDLRALGKFDEAEALDNEYLRKNPGDIFGMRALAYAAQAREDYKLAHDRMQEILKSGKAEANDYNSVAWESLFIGKPSEDDVASILKATQLSQHSAPILHTLGCVYEELGKIKEAREVMIQAMDQLDLTEPKEEYWYAFGRIAEQLGEWQAATTEYRRVTKPKEARGIPSSSYALAQMRLEQMQKAGLADKK